MFKKKHGLSLVFGGANFPKIIFVFCMLVCVCVCTCVRGGDSAICNKLLLSEMIKTNKQKGINLKPVSITYIYKKKKNLASVFACVHVCAPASHTGGHANMGGTGPSSGQALEPSRPPCATSHRERRVKMMPATDRWIGEGGKKPRTVTQE